METTTLDVHAQVRTTYYRQIEAEHGHKVKAAAREGNFAEVEALFLDYGRYLDTHPDAL